MLKFQIVNDLANVPKEYQLFLDVHYDEFRLMYRHPWKSDRQVTEDFGGEMEILNFEFKPTVWHGFDTNLPEGKEYFEVEEELRKNPDKDFTSAWMNKKRMFSYIKETIEAAILINPITDEQITDGTIYLLPYWKTSY